MIRKKLLESFFGRTLGEEKEEGNDSLSDDEDEDDDSTHPCLDHCRLTAQARLTDTGQPLWTWHTVSYDIDKDAAQSREGEVGPRIHKHGDFIIKKRTYILH